MIEIDEDLKNLLDNAVERAIRDKHIFAANYVFNSLVVRGNQYLPTEKQVGRYLDSLVSNGTLKVEKDILLIKHYMKK
jgi:hypothetical protein